ncbi:hypothetical protein [Mycolicibacterium llatzerense]|uniref:hypothetical protein n=1 Tax=Mycolicibacterium llatzerense TaxID=280871 RepID=UPI0021B501A5|nr:hypothetical protein [Mycolicibacterium llatzerense]MCT7361273.1 hypothetical protein [Mycolicibacterium llatzerense]
MTFVWFLLYIAIWFLVGGVIGALIAKAVGYDRQYGFLWGAFLGVIGWTVVVLTNSGSDVSPGRLRVRCPYCEAAQHVASSDDGYVCWQCQQGTILHSGDDETDIHGRCTVQCPSCGKKVKVKASGMRYNCECGSRNNLALYG